MANHGMGGNRRRAVRKALRLRDGNHCTDCRRPFGRDLPATIEHRVPFAAGGGNDKGNLEMLCQPCHLARNRQAWGAA